MKTTNSNSKGDHVQREELVKAWALRASKKNNLRSDARALRGRLSEGRCGPCSP